MAFRPSSAYPGGGAESDRFLCTGITEGTRKAGSVIFAWRCAERIIPELALRRGFDHSDHHTEALEFKKKADEMMAKVRSEQNGKTEQSET